MNLQVIIPKGADLTRQLDHGLVTLTEAICRVTGEESGYGLGGRFGYGENYENDTFAMRRFYWGECDCGYDEAEAKWCDAHSHADDCYRTELKQRERAARLPYWDGDKWHNMDAHSPDERRRVEDQIYDDLCKKYGKDRKFGAAAHCTCSYEKEWKTWSATNSHKATCSLELPNFLHKRTGMEVRWYKYIGRGMEAKNAEGVDLQAVFSECVASLRS